MALNLFAMNHELVWEDPDIYSVRVPYAHLGLEHTNCYIIRDGDDALVIDPGIYSPTAAKSLMQAIEEVGVDIESARFLCTHLHFDHVGLLKRVAGPGTQILMSHKAFEMNPWNHRQLRKKVVRDRLRKEDINQLASLGLAALTSEARVCDLPQRTYELVGDGQAIHVGAHEFRVIETPGHSHGHICLYSDAEQMLFSGDHILEKITPALALPLEGIDSLSDYLASLGRVDACDCRVVLPGHGEAFYDLHARVEDLKQRHARRLGQVYEIVAEKPGVNANKVMRAMPWKRKGPYEDWEAVNAYSRLCMGTQTLSYLEYLVNAGEITRTDDGRNLHYAIA